MKVVILSSFPPTRCGIAAYAEQQARNLEQQGHRVVRHDVHVLNRAAWRGNELKKLAASVGRAGKVVVHYQSGLYYAKLGIPGLKSITPYLGLLKALKAAKLVEIVVHEEYRPYLTPFVRWQRYLVQRVFAMAEVAFMHTRHELAAFQVPVKRKAVLDPATYYQPYAQKSQHQARSELAVQGTVFLAAGFYHPGKGFERLLEAFRAFGGAKVGLVIVTSDREGNYGPELARLRLLAGKAGNVRLVDGYVSDEEFDSWIIASDYVVVPYLYGFTSSLLGRAKIHHKPAIVSSLPALKEQSGPMDLVFKDDQELAAIIRDLTT